MNGKALQGRIAVITGGNRGLGKAIALALAAEGAHVELIARDLDRLKAVAEEIRLQGASADIHPVDVTQESDVAALAERIHSRHGRVQILVNNAGMNLRKNVTDFTLAEWRLLIETNVTSAFLMCRSFVPLLKGQGYGRILNLTSTLSHVALPGRTAYAATKSALLGFTKALALELAPENITVNGISPGPFATELNKPLLDNPQLSQWFLDRIPLGRWGNPADVGAMAVYLCSDQAGFITGTDFLIDGGWTAQ